MNRNLLGILVGVVGGAALIFATLPAAVSETKAKVKVATMPPAVAGVVHELRDDMADTTKGVQRAFEQLLPRSMVNRSKKGDRLDCVSCDNEVAGDLEDLAEAQERKGQVAQK